MTFTRRKFIESSAMAALAATFGHAAGGIAAGRDKGLAGMGAHPLSYLRREHFEPFVNTALTIRNEAGRTSVVYLREVADITETINMERGYRGESFRLSFDAPRRSALNQGMYQFEHENLGQFSLFLAPVGGGGGNLEAIVNRIC
jgi:hypothetical protein